MSGEMAEDHWRPSKCYDNTMRRLVFQPEFCSKYGVDVTARHNEGQVRAPMCSMSGLLGSGHPPRKSQRYVMAQTE